MSGQGIRLFAASLSHLQETRNRLLNIATRDSPADTQDMRLAQMLEEAKDSVKEEFIKITGRSKN